MTKCESIKSYTYPARFESGNESRIVVSFSDVPEAITQGDDTADARAMAADALGLALLSYFGLGQRLPTPSPIDKGRVAITADPDLSAKIAVLEVFREASISSLEWHAASARMRGRSRASSTPIIAPNCRRSGLL